MRKVTRKIAIAILAVLCVPATALALTTANDNYKAKAATAIEGGTATTAVTGEVTLSSFTMQDGAAVRKDTPTGIRFLTDINGSDLAKLPANAEFGTLIMPQTALGENELTRETANVQDVKAKVWYETKDITETAEEGAEPTVVDTLNTFTGVLVGTSATNDFPVAYYNEPIVARSYVTYTDSEENVYTVYAANSQTRSVAYVASAALEDGESDDKNVMKNIVDTVIGDGFSVTADKSILFLGDEAYQLTVTGNKGLVVAYTTSNKDVVTVSEDGKVTAVAAGEASVTATLGTKSFTFTFRVTAPVEQDDTWNNVSEEALNNGSVKYYLNNPGTWSGGISTSSGDNVTIDILSETNKVGDRTSGLYYKVYQAYEDHRSMDHVFGILPTQEKSVYEALATDGATLKYDVLVDTAKVISTPSMGRKSVQATAVNNWLTFEVPVSTLVTNWDTLLTPSSSETSVNMGLIKVEGDATFWVGNFRVSNYKAALEGQNTAWNTVDPANIGTSVNFYSDSTIVNAHGSDYGSLPNLTVDLLADYNEVGGRTTGAYYKINFNRQTYNWHPRNANPEFKLKLLPSQEKTAYEAMLAKNSNAALKYDVYFHNSDNVYQTSDSSYDDSYTMTQRRGYIGTTDANWNEDTWIEASIPLSTLVENYDTITNTETVDLTAGVSTLFSLSGYFSGYSSELTVWIGNIRIEDFTAEENNQTSAWALVDPAKEDVTAKYNCNGTYYTGGIEATILSAYNPVVGRTSGAYWRIVPNYFNRHNQSTKVSVLPENDKAYYEALAEDEAVLKYEVCILTHGTGTSTTQRQIQFPGGAQNVNVGEWETVEVKVSDIVSKWDALTATDDEGVTIATSWIFSVSGAWNDNDKNYNWTLEVYLGNFTVEIPTT